MLQNKLIVGILNTFANFHHVAYFFFPYWRFNSFRICTISIGHSFYHTAVLLFQLSSYFWVTLVSVTQKLLSSILNNLLAFFNSFLKNLTCFTNNKLPVVEIMNRREAKICKNDHSQWIDVKICCQIEGEAELNKSGCHLVRSLKLFFIESLNGI